MSTVNFQAKGLFHSTHHNSASVLPVPTTTELELRSYKTNNTRESLNSTLAIHTLALEVHTELLTGLRVARVWKEGVHIVLEVKEQKKLYQIHT